jgi:hypothetical protein
MQKKVLQILPKQGVNSAQRLIHQHEVDLQGQGPRQGKPLPHAARKLTWKSPRKIRDADAF